MFNSHKTQRVLLNSHLTWSRHWTQNNRQGSILKDDQHKQDDIENDLRRPPNEHEVFEVRTDAIKKQISVLGKKELIALLSTPSSWMTSYSVLIYVMASNILLCKWYLSDTSSIFSQYSEANTSPYIFSTMKTFFED